MNRRSTAWHFLSPSSTLQEFADELAGPGKTLMLDLACGFGRNAIAMAAHGCDVICVDRDFERLRQLDATKSALLDRSPLRRRAGHIATLCADVSEVRWPFGADVFDIIISVHFVCLALTPCMSYSLRSGGSLYMETFGGQGENYRDLPRPGEVKAALVGHLEVRYYKEKPVSRSHGEAVAVKALARKNEQARRPDYDLRRVGTKPDDGNPE